MPAVELVISVAGLLAGGAGAYFAYLQVRGGRWRRTGRSPAPWRPAPPGGVPAGSYDVVISYADSDAGAAEELAGRLDLAGVRAFLARWIEPGLVEYLEKERALVGAANGILLFSRAALADPMIRDEYAALLRRAHTGGRRFIPVLVEDVVLPPFAAIRRPVDLSGAGGAEYESRLATLVRAVRPP